uniref:Uncharacterized protein n=1 Tax=virus sp. ctx9V1 TaxID=2828001 RepID=A0A8S5RCG9_9VIRU|nr:MAG TPA: hypothetical protein [virus sp. ctx9V1]
MLPKELPIMYNIGSEKQIDALMDTHLLMVST